MTVGEFLQRVTDALEAEEPLVPGQQLEELPMWDSLGILSLVDLYDELGVEVDLEQISNAKTTDDLASLAGGAVSG